MQSEREQTLATDKVFSILEENSIFYVIVPPNCTDRLQPLDISVNKAAKEFLRSPFQEWYASKIAFQLKQSARVTEPVDLRLGHSNLMSCCRWTDRLNFLHFALENENLFLEIL